MANHQGAYMLNGVLRMLEEESFFATLGPEKTERFIKRVVDLGYDDDCQSYEILRGIGPRLGICIMCSRPNDDLKNGECPSCREPLTGTYEDG